MKVLLAASEVAPIIKLGGLGDVAASLPKALSELNVNVDVIAPYFSFANTQNLRVYKSIDLEVPFGGRTHTVEVFNTKLPNSTVDVLLLKNDRFFNGYAGRGNQILPESDIFSFFDRAVVSYIESKFNTYDLVHANDWHTGMIVHLLEDEIGSSRPATLFTIHNFMYQGISPTDTLWKLGIVPGAHSLIDYDVSDGDLNFLQQGIASADYVNTVSPSYASEILEDKYPGELTDIIKAREGRFCGIINGVDYDSMPRDFNEHNWRERKPLAKKTMQESLKMPVSDKPVFAYVGRLDPHQKGCDILYEAIPYILEKGGQFVLVGTGDREWEDKFASLKDSMKNDGNLSLNLRFDTELARKVYSGSDYLLIPSKYEPCGLIQMIAMWYGSLPIAHSVGGLRDTVKDRQNGIIFQDYSAESLKKAVDSALSLFSGQDKNTVIEQALSENFSWGKSADSYKNLYNKTIELRKETLSIKLY